MAAKRSSETGEIYQIKVSLMGTRPPIWRRLLVPASFRLDQLHETILTAFGWGGGHMHEFSIGGKSYGAPDPDNDFGMPEVEDEHRARLDSALGGKGARGTYTYDFGDGWEHALLVERVVPADPGLGYPLCSGGKLHGPPDDCGGVGGYYDFLAAIGDPNHPEHDSLLEWIRGSFDPNEFSLEAVNAELEHLRIRKKPRSRRAPS